MFKLGKKARREDPRTLRLAAYADFSKLPPIPAAHSWSKNVQAWPMYMNDRLGDCTAAGAAHMLEAWNAAAARSFVPHDDDVLGFYESTSGYNPADPASDQGAVMIDVLNYWRRNGFCGHKVTAFVEVNFRNPRELQAAIYLFGGAYAGVELPLAAQHQDVWGLGDRGGSADEAAGSWGGHCIPLFDYWDQGALDYYNCVTWGALKRLTGEWLRTYASECYAIVTEDFFLASTGRDPIGLDLDALEKDLRAVTE